MKTYKKIQILASAIGLFVALRCMDSLAPTGNELLAGCMLAVTSIVGLLGLHVRTEAAKEE